MGKWVNYEVDCVWLIIWVSGLTMRWMVVNPLTHIINHSLITGGVPDELKIAKVIPVYKSSDKDELKNYQPISLLPAFFKIFEKVMYIKVISFMDTKNMFYKHQYGFRSKHSTVQPIIHLINECAEENNHTPKY